MCDLGQPESPPPPETAPGQGVWECDLAGAKCALHTDPEKALERFGSRDFLSVPAQGISWDLYTESIEDKVGGFGCAI